MQIKGITDEDFVNYKKASMFIAFPFCSFKCEKESGVCCCHNSSLANSPNIEVSYEALINRYISNPITSAIVCGGLEPFDSWPNLHSLIQKFRERTEDDIVIYTGYNREEIEDTVSTLSSFKNIVIKFGRFIPNQESHFDDILGVKLASPNQYAERIS